MNTDLSTPEGRLNRYCLVFLSGLMEDRLLFFGKDKIDEMIERLATFAQNVQPMVEEIDDD